MTEEIPTYEEYERRLRLAFFELGFEHVVMRLDPKYPLHPNGWPNVAVAVTPGLHNAHIWMATWIAGFPIACWTCWTSGSDRAKACSTGNCKASLDDPQRPPRELLAA